MPGDRDHESHPGYVLLEAKHIIDLTGAVQSLTRVMALRVEKIEREQLLVLKDIATSQTAMHADLKEFLARFDLLMQAFFQKVSNGSSHEDPGADR